MAISIDGPGPKAAYRASGQTPPNLALLVDFNQTVVLYAACYACLSWAIDFTPGVYVMLVHISVVLLNLVCIRRLGNYVLSANIYLVVNCLVAVLGCTYYSGGVLSPVAPWFATGPVTAILLLGMTTNTLLIIGLNFLCVGALAVAGILGIGLPLRYDTRYAGLFYALSQIGLVAAVLLHTRMFHRAESRALQESERSNQALREAKARAEAATVAKSRFLASASHDLRQPAHALGMFVARLGSLPKNVPNDELIRGVESSVRELQDMLDVFFDYSRLDSPGQDLLLGPVQVNAIFTQLRNLFTGVAAEKGLRLVIRPTRLWIHSDPILLQRILLNLLSNAIRYTRSGTVLLSCRPGNGGSHARIEVWDSGIGIAQDLHAQIFEEFFQVGNQQRNRDQGLGLGLAMVERSCRLVQHTLSLRSNLGCGSRFTLLAPLTPQRLAQTEAQEVEAPAGSELQALRVLVIEDDTLANTALKAVLESWGCQVSTFFEAQRAYLHVESGQVPDFVISDYRMSGDTNGIAAIQTLRALCGHPVPACLISGDTEIDLKQQAAAMGLVLLKKPVQPAKLRNLIRRELGSRP
jgi:signal transduction histidine kinase/CheY-like chemotaxis protein